MYDQDNQPVLNPVYQQIDRSVFWRRIFFIALSYLVTIILWLLAASFYVQVGRKIILVTGIAMWIVGAVSAYFIPEQDTNIAGKTKYMLLGYSILLLAYRQVIKIFSSISPDDWGAALGTHIPTAISSAGSGWLQGLLLVVLISVPSAYFYWIAQLYITHRGRGVVNEQFNRYQRRDY